MFMKYFDILISPINLTHSTSENIREGELKIGKKQENGLKRCFHLGDVLKNIRGFMKLCKNMKMLFGE